MAHCDIKQSKRVGHFFFFFFFFGESSVKHFMDTLHKKLQSRKQTVRANNCAQNCISSPPPSFLHTCYFPVSVFNALTVATQSPHSRSHTSVKELVSRKKQAERQRTGLFGLLWCRSFVLMWLPTFQRVQTKLITINSTRILPTIL